MSETPQKAPEPAAKAAEAAEAVAAEEAGAAGAAGAAAGARSEAEPGSMRLVLTMTVAGLLAGLILVGAYLITLPRIQQNRYDAMQVAIRQVLEGTEEVRTWVVRGGALAPYEGPAGVLPEEEAIFSGHDASGGLVGYAVPAEGAGFQDTIGLIYGYDPVDEHIVGMAVLECKETPGLGDRIIFDEAFLASFQALAVEPAIEGTKSGREAPNEVDVISGATISSEAVISILNDSIAHWQPLLNAAAQASAGGTQSAEATAHGE